MPTLSEVRRWGTAHLTEAAEYWTGTASVWEDHFTQLVAHVAAPGGAPWEGRAAEAAQHRAYSDRMTVIGLADQLHSASAIARRGATDIAEARLLVLRTVESAESAGFTVGEDFSVTDPRLYDAGTAAVRQTQAEAFATDLRARVGTLVATDSSVAGQLTAATAGLGTTSFPEMVDSAPPEKRTVQAVDYRQSPADADGPGPLDPVTNADDVRKILGPLENGDNRPNKQLDTEADIRRLYDWLVRGSVGDDTKTGFPRRVLADGTIIGIRSSNKNGATLQVDYPNGKVQKVHLPSALIAEAPQLPSAPHAPGTVAPPQTFHPPVPLPAQKTELPGLPPWLQNPSPPGFAVSPVQSPPVVPWDVPDVSPKVPVPALPTSAPPGSSWSWLPELAREAADAGKTVGTWTVVIGGVAVATLFGLGSQGGLP